MSEYLSRIEHPHDVKKLSLDELEVLAEEIRERIMGVVDKNGGHLASNLGSTELTIALHKVYDFPRDRLVWDTSHQTYPHKLLTGRRDRFHLLRQYGGICGFCNHQESVFDLFDAGHAGTAASLAAGVAAGDRLRGSGSKSIAVVGDSALAAGMAFEAMNHAGDIRPNLLLILNDNNMSIDHSVGAFSEHLNRIRTKPIYQDFKKEIHEILSRIPLIGKHLDGVIETIAEKLKHNLVPGQFFQELGFNYYGPIDGHDLPTVINTLEDIRRMNEPVLLHALTVKGHGYKPAISDPVKYHALKNFKSPAVPKKPEPENAEPKKPSAQGYTNVFTDVLLETARKDERIVAITAGMSGGTGLIHFGKEFPDRFFDVGIAEQHGCAFASGLSLAGQRPVFAVYSTFCQRAYDQFVHDVCIQEKSVIFALDRAGLPGEDGWTHHGAFDISFMRCIPNVILIAPRDGDEMRRMFQFCVDQTVHPIAIRYPKANVPDLPEVRPEDQEIVLGKGEVLVQGEDLVLFAYGAMVDHAYQAAQAVKERGINVTVVNARFAKPIDDGLLRELSRTHAALVTVEEHALAGGFGSGVLEACIDGNITFQKIVRLGVPDQFITFGSRAQLLKDVGLDVDGIAATVEKTLETVSKGAPRYVASDAVEPRTDFVPAGKRTPLN
jgi:1-deoxy-D-xylulose-5-phosphate synthase